MFNPVTISGKTVVTTDMENCSTLTLSSQAVLSIGAGQTFLISSQTNDGTENLPATGSTTIDSTSTIKGGNLSTLILNGTVTVSGNINVGGAANLLISVSTGTTTFSSAAQTINASISTANGAIIFGGGCTVTGDITCSNCGTVTLPDEAGLTVQGQIWVYEDGLLTVGCWSTLQASKTLIDVGGVLVFTAGQAGATVKGQLVVKGLLEDQSVAADVSIDTLVLDNATVQLDVDPNSGACSDLTVGSLEFLDSDTLDVDTIAAWNGTSSVSPTLFTAGSVTGAGFTTVQGVGSYANPFNGQFWIFSQNFSPSYSGGLETVTFGIGGSN